MEAARELIRLIQEVAQGIYDGKKQDGHVTLILDSVSPITMRMENIEIEYVGSEVIMPKGLYFKDLDIGKRYICAKADDGQSVYVLYERS